MQRHDALDLLCSLPWLTVARQQPSGGPYANSQPKPHQMQERNCTRLLRAPQGCSGYWLGAVRPSR